MKLQNDCYELEQTSSKCIKVEKFRKKLFVLWYTNIEWRTTNCHQRIFRKVLTIH